MEYTSLARERQNRITKNIPYLVAGPTITYVKPFMSKIARLRAFSTQEQKMFLEFKKQNVKKIYVTRNLDVWAVVDAKNTLVEQREKLIGIQGENKMDDTYAFGATQIIQISNCNHDGTYSAVAVIPLVD